MSTLSQRAGAAPAISVFALAALALAVALCGAAAPAKAAWHDVRFSAAYPAGEIIISQHQRALYFTEGDGRAIRYPVAIGKRGMAWLGSASVEGKYLAPDWSPPEIVAHDHPELPSFIPGGSPHNPMGAAAITLSRYQVAIHGTTRHMRRSIGTAASYGCIRMYNEDVEDLYQRVSIGTPVLAVP
jgi:lipoprotein-anchoring transpeptidase ErfK/SrfK